MDNQIKLSMIECLCKSISFLVQWATDNEMRKAPSACDSIGVQNDNKHTGEHDFTARIITLSKVVMEFLESDNVPNLAPHKFDDKIIGCLLDVYRMPSVANGFETDTVAFYDWWRRLIQSWIRCPVCGDYQQLGCCHLAAMIEETTGDDVRVCLDESLLSEGYHAHWFIRMGTDSLVKFSSMHLESQQNQQQNQQQNHKQRRKWKRTECEDRKARKRQATTTKVSHTLTR